MLDGLNITLISNIVAGKNDWTMNVRIICVWCVPDKKINKGD